MKEYASDVLIIGAGGAGLRAAIEAADAGTSVIVVGKSLLGKCHTVMAEGGINAALGNVDPQDSWKIYNVVTRINRHHDAFLWMTLFFAALRFTLVLIQTGSLIQAIPGTV